MTAFSYHRSLMGLYMTAPPSQETPRPLHGTNLLKRQEARHSGEVRRERDRDGGERDRVERVEERHGTVAPLAVEEEDRRARQLEEHDPELREDQQVRHPGDEVGQIGAPPD